MESCAVLWHQQTWTLKENIHCVKLHKVILWLCSNWNSVDFFFYLLLLCSTFFHCPGCRWSFHHNLLQISRVYFHCQLLQEEQDVTSPSNWLKAGEDVERNSTGAINGKYVIIQLHPLNPKIIMKALFSFVFLAVGDVKWKISFFYFY